jgi:hypothetical protein
MTGRNAEQTPTLPGVGALPETSDLDVAVTVARRILASYGDSSRDGFTYPAAYGATYEALRLLVRAVGNRCNCPTVGPRAAMNPDDEKGYSLASTPGGDQRCPAAHPEARELRELLAAVREALTLPFDTDDYDRRLIARAGWAHTVMAAVLDDTTEDVGWNADFLRSKLTADSADTRRGEGQ